MRHYYRLKNKTKKTIEKILKKLKIIRTHTIFLPENCHIDSLVNCITDNSYYDRYIIYLDPGIYIEPAINMKSFVSLEGSLFYNLKVIIKNEQPVNKHGFIRCHDVQGVELENLNIQCDIGDGCIIKVTNSPNKKSELSINNTHVNTR